MFEEIQEYKESENVEELADILEAMQALVEHVHAQKWEDVLEIQSQKRKERGGFCTGVVLERVE